MKSGLMVNILGVSMIILVGILLSTRAFAASSAERAYALAEEDCKKIATQLGEKTPANLYIGGTDLNTYSVGCGFASGSLGYASQQIEDIQITIDAVGVARRTPEAVRTLQAKKASLKDTEEVFEDGFVEINRGTPDGSEYIYKGYLLFGWPELRKTHTAKVSIDRGTCGVSVTARSRYKDKSPGGHHTSNPETGGDINNHPGFNHDREAEMLALAREKGIELLNALDCGNDDISSPSSTIPVVVTEVPSAENQVPQNPYTDCAWNCAEQTEAKYQCPFKFPLDSCVTDKMSYQSTCQNACWDQWRLPSKPNLVERGVQINKVEQDGKIALLVVGHDSSKPSDSAIGQMKDDLVGWDPDAVRLNVPTSASNIPLGIGVLSLDGNDIDIKRPGSKAWEPLRKGTAIPEGSQIFTGIDSNVWIYGRFGVANIAHGSYITIKRDSANQGNDPNIRFDIKFGEVEIRYEKANYQGIIQTRTPSATATVRGTKFITSYNQEYKYSTVGVYEGQVEVQSLITGEKVALSSDMGSDLVFIPLQKPREKDKETPVVIKQESQEQKSIIDSFIPAVVILGLTMALLILQKKGKLKPLYEKYKIKISEIIRKISKTGKEKE